MKLRWGGSFWVLKKRFNIILSRKESILMRMKMFVKILCSLVLIAGLSACVPENKHANDSRFDASTIHPAEDKDD